MLLTTLYHSVIITPIFFKCDILQALSLCLKTSKSPLFISLLRLFWTVSCFLCPSVRYRGAMTVAQGKPCTTTRRSDAVLYALLTATGFGAVLSSCIVFVIPPHCHCPFLVLQTEPAFPLQVCQSLLENRVL